MEDYSVWGRSHSPEEIWRRYFETLGEAARSGLFDILAHPDLVKVWGRDRPRPEGDLRRYYELAIDGIAESGIAVEVSTAGLRKRAQELYPAPAFLEMCLEAGAPGGAFQRRAPARGRRRRLRAGAGAAGGGGRARSCACSSGASGGWRASSRTVPEPADGRDEPRRDRL